LREAISVSGLGFVDEKGAFLQNITVGKVVSIQSTLKNNNQEEQSFVQIIQIQNSSGCTVFLDFVDGMLQSDQTLHTSWRPDKEGKYSIQVSVWTSIDSPLPLSLDL